MLKKFQTILITENLMGKISKDVKQSISDFETHIRPL